MTKNNKKSKYLTTEKLKTCLKKKIELQSDKEEFDLKEKKDYRDNRKRVFETYREVLIHNDITTLAYGSESFRKEFVRELELTEKAIHGFGLVKEETHNMILQNCSATKCFMNSDKDPVQSDIDYFEELIKVAEHKIEDMEYEKKKKIADNYFLYKRLWSEQFNIHTKMNNKLKEIVKANSPMMHLVEKGHYLCNRATKITKIKSTKKKDLVTCKNCLYLLKKEKK